MDYIVPPSLLFEFRLAVAQCGVPSKRKTGPLFNLPEEARLFMPSCLNDGPRFAETRLGWNKDGLAIELSVTGKSAKPLGWASGLDASDCWKLWIDTRPSGKVHKATEYCHCFAVLPSDTDNDGAPTAAVQMIAQQRATKIEANMEKLELRLHTNSSGYQLDVWIPGTQLYGFREISELGRIGFYCVANDSELGQQHFGVGDEFPISYDPSTWTQLELNS